MHWPVATFFRRVRTECFGLMNLEAQGAAFVEMDERVQQSQLLKEHDSKQEIVSLNACVQGFLARNSICRKRPHRKRAIFDFKIDVNMVLKIHDRMEDHAMITSCQYEDQV